MQWYSTTMLADWASILGFIVSGLAFLKISSVKRSVSLNTIRRTVDRLFQEVEDIPDAKTELTETQTESVRQLLRYVEMFFLSRWNPKQCTARQLHKKMYTELGGKPQVANIKRDAKMLRDQFFMFA